MPDLFEEILDESETGVYATILVDEATPPVAIPGSVFTALTLTWLDSRMDAATGIVNNRDDQDILNANNVTIDESGALTWKIQKADTAIIVTPRPSAGTIRIYRAIFTGDWLDGGGATRRIVHRRDFQIRVVEQVPA